MIKAKTISDAWFQALCLIIDKGYKQEIQRGSFEQEQTRLQLPFISGVVEFPLYDMIPQVPFGIPQPTTARYIEEYFHTKIIGSIKTDNEEYTYGERIISQLPDVIDMLQKTPLTNQAVIEVARPSDLLLPDPPCLRVISFKCVPHEGIGPQTYDLNICVFFRSWECWAGLPTNLGGMALLQQYVAGFIEGAVSGRMFFASDGLHLYDMAIGYAKQKCNKE